MSVCVSECVSQTDWLAGGLACSYAHAVRLGIYGVTPQLVVCQGGLDRENKLQEEEKRSGATHMRRPSLYVCMDVRGRSIICD